MLGSLFPKREERALNVWGSWQGEPNPTWAGVDVDTRSSLQLLTVYGCVRLISDSIATLPLDVLRETPDGSVEQLATPGWLEEPIVGLHRTAWLGQVLSSLLLDGNAYIAVMAVGARIVELIPLNAKSVTVSREGGIRKFKVHGSPATFPIIHIPGLMLAGAEVGLSPVEAARQSIGAGIAAQEFGARFFGQGAVMSGVIEDPGEVNPDKARDMAKAWGKKHSGLSNSHLPGVLQGGATWKPTGVTNEQAQFLETRGYTAAEIAGQMFLLDPSDLGIPTPSGSSLTYANLEQRNIRRVQVALMPWIVRIEMALSGLLAQPRYVKFNVGALLRGDTLARFQAYRIALGDNVPFMVPDEAREFEDWSPMPGGNMPADPMPAGGPPNG